MVVIGAGPAGLMAAHEMAKAGCAVRVMDAMPSVGRKFLMAGKSGLNLTKNEPMDRFLCAYGKCPDVLQTALREFDPEAVMRWATDLGQEVFTGSTKRVFPKSMKGSPLLRSWMAQLVNLGVTFHTRWVWQGWDAGALVFDTAEGPQTVTCDGVVLALGGGSWARLGSNGVWVQHFPRDNVQPFLPSNVGLNLRWSDHMQRHFGQPIKGCSLSAGGETTRGEFVISKSGLEGGGIYMMTRAVRAGHDLVLDLCPDLSVKDVQQKLARPQGKTSLANHLRRCLKLTPAQIALLNEFGRPFPANLAPLIKALPLQHAGFAPLDHAISTAGGFRFDLLDGFMIRDQPGVFLAGEMLNWDAPTGGYLINGCLATGRMAGRQAADFALNG
ncbi:TIGR03862 family flavoprotein [Aestuariibius sp. HNIBRBA575]|uniref:TIGR03862 family flavoprotein n=1 Tax=Aestuariibius sp. HNIBRBA575 TaxID=3233343 RepID=UPI0034A56B60